jgi:hypothetical protein
VALARLPFAALLCACTGQIDQGASDEAGSGAPPGSAATPGVAPSGGLGAPADPSDLTTPTPPGVIPGLPATGPIGAAQRATGVRRLLADEVQNTVRDLLGVDVDLAALPADPTGRAVRNANLARVGYGELERYVDVAQRAAAAAASRLAGGCPAGAPTDRAGMDCARKLLEGILPRAFRRPLEPGEVDAYAALLTDPDAGTPEARLGRALQAVLLAPSFLYRTELGTPTPGIRQVTLRPHEIASRLSYLLWTSMPDAPLMQAATSGRLQTADGRLAEAKRMLADPRARTGLQALVIDWLGLRGVGLERKQASVLKNVPARVAGDFLQELTLLADELLPTPNGALGALLDADHAFVNGPLRAIYGLPASAAAAFERVALPPNERRGLLTQGLVIAAHAKEIGESPTQLGQFVRERVMCQPVPAPPDDVNTDLPSDDAAQSKTLRQRLERHMADPVCAGCHTLFDPPGYAFLPYDPIGRYRAKDGAGRPYDTTGTLTNLDGASVAFTSAPDLAHRLAGSATVARCFAEHVQRALLGRAPRPEEEADVDRFTAAFARDGGQVQAALLALVADSAFTRAPSPLVDPGEPPAPNAQR